MPPVFESVRYEAYGPAGTALLVDCLTDSRERTLAQVREVLQRFGGHLGARGSVSYLFNHVGLMRFPPVPSEKKLVRVALDAGAEDVVRRPDGSMEVLADPLEFEAVRGRLQSGGFVAMAAGLTQRASTPVPLEGGAALAMAQFIEALEDLNDVQNVYTNAEIPDEVLARF